MMGLNGVQLIGVAILAIGALWMAMPKIKALPIWSFFKGKAAGGHSCTRVDCQAAIDEVLHYASETDNSAMYKAAQEAGKALYAVPLSE